MQKTFCEICGKEVIHSGRLFFGESGRLLFKICASVDKDDMGDPCLDCVLKAINKEVKKVLTRKYTRKQKPQEQIKGEQTK